MADDALSWLQQLLGGGQDAPVVAGMPGYAGPQQPGGGIGALFDAISGSPTIQAMRAPNAGAIDLSAATGLPPAMESMLGAERAYDPSRSFAANALDPRSIEQAMNIAMSTGPGAIKAYHGSPYDFERFDMSKIGTGEGAQAYGHGLYFAENPETAQIYRDQVKNMPLIDTINERLSALSKEMDVLSPSGYRQFTGPQAGRGRELAAEYDRLMEEKLKPGRMYEAQINAEPEHFLNWDKPLSQQSEEVRAALGRVPWAQDYLATGKDITGGVIAPKTAEGASQLREAGIPGIRYLDQGSRNVPPIKMIGDAPIDMNNPAHVAANALHDARGDVATAQIRLMAAGTKTANDAADLIHAGHDLPEITTKAAPGTSNYAVFDDKLIEILRKYGILPPLAAGAAGAGLLGSGSEPPT